MFRITRALPINSVHAYVGHCGSSDPGGASRRWGGRSPELLGEQFPNEVQENRAESAVVSVDELFAGS